MEQILQYFETELEYMRRGFADFEKSHPQKAKALGITAGRSTDPNVQRLADALALHAARLSKRLDDTLPETALDLMRILAPTFLLGAPSYAAVQLAATAEEFGDALELAAGSVLPIAVDGETPSCRFTVARDVALKPVSVSAVRIEQVPFAFEVPQGMRGCEAAICVTLTPLDASQSLSELAPDQIELYVNAPGGRKQRLIEVLAGDVIGLGYAATEGRGAHATHVLDKSGFALSMQGEDRTFLPRKGMQAPAISRLRDFLAYPDKAAFFTLRDTDGGFAKVAEGGVELRFFISGEGLKQLSDMGVADLATNVVPVVNLYTDHSRPVRYDYGRQQVPVLPTTSADMHVESLQIRDLRQLTPEGEQLLPAMTSPQRRADDGLAVWQERYQIGEFNSARREVSFSVNVGLGQDPEPLDFVASLYCSNGSAACAPRPGAQVFFDDDTLAKCPFELIDEPTAPVSPDVSAAKLWDVMSMLNGNFATIFDAENPSEALKEALHLCAPSGYADAANGIWDVTVSQSIAPVSVGKNVLLSAGSRIEVVLDADALPYSRTVFATALHFVFAAMISYDRFFQLSVRERGRAEPFKVFPRQHGSQTCG